MFKEAFKGEVTFEDLKDESSKGGWGLVRKAIKALFIKQQ